MSYQNDYIQMYNLTVGMFQNMFTNVVEMDFKYDLMLYTNLIQYEQYFFECCIFLLKFSIYYITFLIFFEFVSKTLETVNIYSSVTRKYIRKYHRSQEEIEMLYSELSKQSDEMHELKKQLEDLQLYNECQKNVVMDDKLTQFPDNVPIPVPIPSGPVTKKIIRKAAKKATKTIKELVEQRLV
jgi:hypothetical protein